MSTFKPQQRHLTIQGRAFHFVAYEGQSANPTRKLEERPAMWYLMVEGRRCPVATYDPDQADQEIDRFLTRWAMDNAFGPGDEPAEVPPTDRRGLARRSTNWWGPN